MFKYLLLISTVLLFAAAPPLHPDQGLPDDDTVAMIRANYLYQFSSNNNWPTETKKGKFYVGIYGNPSVYSIMAEKYGAKPIGSQTLDVISLATLSATQPLHVLYVDKSKKSDLAKAIKEYSGKSTLIVTNWEGALAQGAQINFKNVDGAVRYEMSKQSMEDRKITAGIKILQWAIQ